jgi:4a-hydroxytetrahydrobiopterin dehydratase
MQLQNETCIPCHQGEPELQAEGLKTMCDQLDGWTISDAHHLNKHLTFADFSTALAWVNRAGEICEQQGHHADFRLGWGYVEVDIYTHKTNVLTRADGILAAKFDAIEPGPPQTLSSSQV